jgi:anti-sigma factor ChrR (cupin superfamily)
VDHASAAELLGVYALDACEEDEAKAVEGHLSQCEECRKEAERLQTVAGWMGASEAMAPSAEVRSKLLQDADQSGLDPR